MPKLFEYLGIVVLFYSNKHLPVHDHGKDQGRESRAELVVENGRVVDVVLGTVRGRRPLDGDQLKDFEAVVRHSGDDIVRRGFLEPARFSAFAVRDGTWSGATTS